MRQSIMGYYVVEAHQQDLLREAEQYRLAREAEGYKERYEVRERVKGFRRWIKLVVARLQGRKQRESMV